MNMPTTEPFEGETLLADGWEYRDVPTRMRPDLWDEFLDIIGAGNYRLLTLATYEDGYKRGQMFVSPDGLKNLREYDARKSAGTPG